MLLPALARVEVGSIWASSPLSIMILPRDGLARRWLAAPLDLRLVRLRRGRHGHVALPVVLVGLESGLELLVLY